jgi:tetratricopeptide (TPR) repeat protein
LVLLIAVGCGRGAPDATRAARFSFDCSAAGRLSERLSREQLMQIAACRGQYEIAERELRHLLRAADEPRLRFDLAAVVYEQALEREDPWLLIEALEELELGLVSRPDDPQGLGYRDLVLDRLHVRRLLAPARPHVAAGSAEATSPSALAPPPVTRVTPGREPIPSDEIAAAAARASGFLSLAMERPQDLRRFLEEDAFPELARRAAHEGPAEARAWLTTIREAADDFREVTGDDLVVRSARLIESNWGTSEAAALLTAHERLGRAVNLYRSQDTDGALAALRPATDVFERAGDPFSYWARYYAAVCEYASSVTTARASLSALLEETPSSFSSLRGDLLWRIGIAEQVGGDVLAALRSYQASQELQRRVGGDRGAAFGSVLMATALDQLGSWKQAWAHRIEAFRALAPTEDYWQRHSMIDEAVEALLLRDRPLAARVYAECLVHNANQWGQAVGLSEAYEELALAETKAGRHREAREHLRHARSALDRLGDSPIADRSRASLTLVEGAILAGTEPQLAVGLLRGALDEQTQAGYRYREVETNRLLAQALFASGRRADALDSLRDGLRALQTVRTGSASFTERSRALNDSRSLIGTWLDVLLDLSDSDPVEAQWLGELGRRLQFEFLREAETDSSAQFREELRRLERTLPSDTALVAIVEGSRKILVSSWRGTWKHRILPADGDVEDLLNTLHRSRVGNAAAVLDASEELGRLLLGSEATEPPRRMWVVSDPTQTVPVHALRVDHPPRWILEATDVLYLPSFASASVSKEGAARKSIDYEPPMILANSAPVTGYETLLPPLPGVAAESAALVRLLDGTMVTTVSRQSLLETWSSPSLLHLAGHTLLEPGDPPLPAFVMPGGELLRVPDILEAPEPPPDLVFLSTCRGSWEGPSQESSLGLAGAFLLRGSRRVLAASIAVSDDRALAFSEAFYGRYREQAYPDSAYRAAALDLLSAGDSGDAFAWIDYRLYGLP